MPPNTDVIICVDALCRYFKIKNIRGEKLQNNLIDIKNNLLANGVDIRKYLEEVFKPVIESEELPKNTFDIALNVEITEWIKGLENRINNTACLY